MNVGEVRCPHECKYANLSMTRTCCSRPAHGRWTDGASLALGPCPLHPHKQRAARCVRANTLPAMRLHVAWPTRCTLYRAQKAKSYLGHHLVLVLLLEKLLHHALVLGNLCAKGDVRSKRHAACVLPASWPQKHAANLAELAGKAPPPPSTRAAAPQSDPFVTACRHETSNGKAT